MLAENHARGKFRNLKLTLLRFPSSVTSAGTIAERNTTNYVEFVVFLETVYRFKTLPGNQALQYKIFQL